MSSDQPNRTPEPEAEELARFREEWRKEVEAKRDAEAKDRSATLAARKAEAAQIGNKQVKTPYGIGERARRVLERSPDRTKGSAVGEATAALSTLSLSPSSTSTASSSKKHSGETVCPHEGGIGSSGGTFQPQKKPTRAVSAAAAREGIVPSDAGLKAVELYARAVEFEQSGQLNEALHLYRKAYKLDGSVEKAYRKKELEFEREAMSVDTALSVTDPTLPIEVSQAPEPYTFSDTKQFHPDYVSPHARPSSSKQAELGAVPRASDTQSTPSSSEAVAPSPADPLSVLVHTWPSSDLVFTPEEETYPVHISLLPDELFQPIFSFMDVQTLERFGTTCKKLRYLSRGAEKWKRLCERLYRAPILPEPNMEGGQRGEEAEGTTEVEAEAGTAATNSLDESLSSSYAPSRAEVAEDTKASTEYIDALALETAARALARARRKQVIELARRHAFDWRTTFLEERRIRYDGVYISVCHYVRPGQSDLAWVNITHLITYHRFLRFYPDGSVISLLTTDHPVDVVHTIKPSFRAKGLLFGTWEMGAMKNDKGVELPKLEVRSLLEPGTTPKYEFEMDLSLKCSTRGRWNKLEMLTYQSINLASGEALGLSLKHQKPFFFSKVRSYRESL